MKQYLMRLLVGLCLGIFTHGYGMQSNPMEGFNTFLKGYDNYRRDNNLKDFFSSFHTKVVWGNAIDNVESFVRDNYKNVFGVVDNDLSSALNGFLGISSEYYSLAKKQAAGRIDDREIRDMDDDLDNMLSHLDGTRVFLSKKHISRNKENARAVLNDAFNILESLIKELRKGLPGA